MMNGVKLIMAVALLLCLLPMSYGYYVLFRFAAMVVFAVMAYQYYIKESEVLMVIFGALALLFQPIILISLGCGGAWNCVDIAVAVLLFYLLWKERSNELC